MVFRVVFPVAIACLLTTFSGCGKAKVERIEWTTMGTIAAIQTRGGTTEEWKASDHVVMRSFVAVNDEFNLYDSNSTVRVSGTCSSFGRPCADCAEGLSVQSDRAFNPHWRRDGLPDYGAIAKGFAVDIASGAVTNLPGDLLIDLGGNLKSVCGDWQVGIAGSDIIITLTNGMACATSAEYFRGKHIYDGRTGLAVTNGLKSVTVVHPTSAMLADGLSTTLFVLGREEGEKFLKKHYPEARAYWVEKD